jgi:hypothetical protein
MPELESNLLYASAQQTKPWRAGTPGRAPRYRRAVVEIRRPLCLFIQCCALFAFVQPSFAQRSSPSTSFQVRAGLMISSALARDELGSRPVSDSIPGQSESFSIKQELAPAVGVAVLIPLRERTELEISLGVATSSLQSSNDFESWDAGDVTVVNALVGVAYAYRPTVIAHGGVGLTKLFGDQQLLDAGNGFRPLLEAGLSVGAPFHPALQLDARAQLHRFNTTALQNEGATDGTVLRLLVGAAYTLGGAR